MKKLLFTFALLSLISCDKEDTETNNPENPNTTTNLYTEGAGVTDFEGNTYKTIIITTSAGTKSTTGQEWMAENLRATKYADGTSIPPTAMSICNRDTTTIPKLGYLYTWDAVMNNSTVEGSQGACPDGWHVPTVDEYNTLINALGGAAVAGKKMKAIDTVYWSNNTMADNSSGFSALGTGSMMSGMHFFYKSVAKFWTSTEDGTDAREVQVEGDEEGMFNSYGSSKTNVQNSCRCIKD